MALDSTKKYITLPNLSKFLAELKSSYANNTTSSFIVAKALSADTDGTGRNIVATYHTISDFNTFKSGYDKFYSDTTSYAYDKIHSISFKGSRATTATPLTPDSSKNIVIDLSNYALLSDLSAVLKFRGTLADKPTLDKITSNPAKKDDTTVKYVADLAVGDVYLLTLGETYDDKDSATGSYTEQNVEYVCTKISEDYTVTWEKLGSTYDFSVYAEKTWVSAEIQKAQDNLSGEATKLAGRVTTLEGKVTTLNGDINTTGSVIKTATDIANSKITEKLNTINYDSSTAVTTGDFVTEVKQTSGAISVTKGSLTIATDNEISGLFLTSSTT